MEWGSGRHVSDTTAMLSSVINLRYTLLRGGERVLIPIVQRPCQYDLQDKRESYTNWHFRLPSVTVVNV